MKWNARNEKKKILRNNNTKENEENRFKYPL